MPFNLYYEKCTYIIVYFLKVLINTRFIKLYNFSVSNNKFYYIMQIWNLELLYITRYKYTFMKQKCTLIHINKIQKK